MRKRDGGVTQRRQFILFTYQMVVGFTITPGKATATIPYADVELSGMTPVNMEGGITKLLSDDLLIYVKPIPEFFTSEHTPLLCWKGSGYSFKNVDKVFFGRHQFYQGILIKGVDILYTAWWYTNGYRPSISSSGEA